MRRAGYLAGVLLLAGCINNPTAETAGPPEFDMYAAVVHHFADRLPTAGKQWVFAVSLPDGLSEEAFCRRFRGEAVPAFPTSVGVIDNAEQRVFHIHFYAPFGETFVSEGTDRVTVAVLAYPAAEPPDSSTPNPIALRREGNKWVVAGP